MKKIKLFLFLMGFAGMANATVYYVNPAGSGTDGLTWETAYTSPVAALAGSPVSGDEVWVKQGTYVSASTISWKTGINFYGGFTGTETQRSERSKDAALTILEGTNTNRVLNAPAMASPTTWDGFTIQKGLTTAGGAGIFMQKNAILQNCIIQNNTTTDFGGGGIFIQGASTDADSIKVINCVIKNNINTKSGATKRGGGGIYVKAGSFLAVIRGCTIEGNTVDGLANSGSDIDGGGVYLCDGKLENSVIKNNTATNKNATTLALSYNGKCQGGGVFIMPQTTNNPIVVKNCTITGNTANTSLGGGLAIDPLWTSAVIASNVSVTNCVITNNWAYKAGGGILAEGQAPTSTASYYFTNCVIANNESSSVAAGGGGAFVNNILDYAGTVAFENCHVVNNKMLTTNYGGAGIFYNNMKADISNCVFWGNGSTGTLAPYHVRVKNTLTTNKLVNCAFDNLFVESQVSPTATPADLSNKVIVDIANNGSTEGTLYAKFKSPTNFIGKVLTAENQTSLDAADWKPETGSALINAGKTTSTLKDMAGIERPQGGAFEIGAYEFIPEITTGNISNDNQMFAYSSNGQIIINHSGKASNADIFNLLGSKVKQIQLNEGQNFINLPINQIYIIQTGNKTMKILNK